MNIKQLPQIESRVEELKAEGVLPEGFRITDWINGWVKGKSISMEITWNPKGEANRRTKDYRGEWVPGSVRFPEADLHLQP